MSNISFSLSESLHAAAYGTKDHCILFPKHNDMERPVATVSGECYREVMHSYFVSRNKELKYKPIKRLQKVTISNA